MADHSHPTRDARRLFDLPRPVWLLGWVSLATDSATEAIYPLLPFFLTRVLGAGAVSLGVLEGAAEAVNSALKIVSGRVADRSPRKRPLVLFGYAISSIARPFIALATTFTQVFIVRVLDRVGKGVRGAPRDAMLAVWTTPGTRGKVYGFHRSMDHIGAVVGPALASVFLWFYPEHYRTLFALTIVPGAMAVALIFLVPEKEVRLQSEVRLKPDTTYRSAAGMAVKSDVMSGSSSAEASAKAVSRIPTPLSGEFTAFMFVLTLFTLGNSTDAFLLLKLTDVAGTARFVPLMWAALHVVKAVDRIGRRAVIVLGWLVYAVVYAGFAISGSLRALVAWFLVYGFYFGFAEGTEKALVADLAPPDRRGFAFGVYNAVQGLGSLAASIVFGLVWKWYGDAAAFGLGAVLALTASALLFTVVRPSRPI